MTPHRAPATTPHLPPYDPAALAQACRRLGVVMVVAFGSRATGRPVPTPESDLDLAFLGGQASLPTCLRELGPVFPQHDLDLVQLDQADPLLRHEIMRSSVLLYGDPDLYCEYKAYAYRDFVDSADLRQLEDRLFRLKMNRIRKALNVAS
jgi:predicted nucleotidyltransferase